MLASSTVRDLVVVGSGPNGLATALHARQRGLDVLVIERGHLAESIAQFPKEMVFLGLAHDQEIGSLPCSCPRTHLTREEVLTYLNRVAELAGIEIAEQTTFCGLEGRAGDFVVRATRGGEPVRMCTRALVLATGIFGQPNRLHVPGADLAKVVYAYHDPYTYRRQRVAIVGAGNGAAEAALRLFNEAGAEVTVLNRSSALDPDKWRWQFPDLDTLVERRLIRLVHSATVERIEESHLVFTSPAGRERIGNDHVIVQIGYRPDTALFDAIGIDYDDTAAPAIDPRTLETNVKGVYVAGNIATGTADFVLIRSGRNHGKVIVAHILGEDVPGIRDLGVKNPAHWMQFGDLDDPLDHDLALDMVPMVVGSFQHQLLDVYKQTLLRHHRTMQERGIPVTEWSKHPMAFASVIDALSTEHLDICGDGTVIFKGRRLPAHALDILRLADGTRRIRDIIIEMGADIPAEDMILDLLRAGKLTWRPAPLPAPAPSGS